jgi:hypothetical protein
MSVFYRYDGNVRNGTGYVISGAIIYVCTQPAVTSTIPPSPLATIYSDNAGANPINQTTAPLQTDGNGNFFFYAATGVYTIEIYDPLNRIPTTIYVDQQVVTQGGGSVTSVAMTGDGVIFNSTVSGSPITASGTLVPALLTQNANKVLAGPASGPAATPTFRSLVSADLPGGVGTVSSVAASISGASLLSMSVTGTPITTSGTLAFTINFANQNANTFLAGPSSGAAGAVTARAMVAADAFGRTAVSSGASVNFDCSTFPWPTFDLTLNQNTVFTITNAVAGQHFTLVIRQNGTGGWTLTFPGTFFGQSEIESGASAVSVQDFVCISSSEYRATGPGQVNAT